MQVILYYVLVPSLFPLSLLLSLQFICVYSEQAGNVSEFGFDAAVVGAVFSQKSVVVVTVVELLFGHFVGSEEVVVLIAGPGHQVLARLQVGSPSLDEEVVVFALKVEFHFPLLVESGSIEVVTSVVQKLTPLVRLQLVSFLLLDNESLVSFQRFVKVVLVVVVAELFSIGLLSIRLLLIEFNGGSIDEMLGEDSVARLISQFCLDVGFGLHFDISY